MGSKNTNLIWIDLEMTGLDVHVNRIIEIATVITDADLNVIAEGPVLAISQDEAQLATMDDWNVEHHTRSGLVDRVKTSMITEKEAEQRTLDFLKEHVYKNQSPICGNSISMDRRFLFKYMPKLEDYFHYRQIDVSTIKELARRWYPKIFKGFSKPSDHQALNDIKGSIDELKYYRKHLFIHD